MKILFDNSWQGMTGIGRVSQFLLKNLSTDFQVETIEFSYKKINPLYTFLIYRDIKKYNFDIFISPGFFPPSSNVRSIIFFYDMGHIVSYSFFHKLYMYLIRPFYQNVSLIVTDSDYILGELKVWLKNYNVSIKRFYLGSELSKNPSLNKSNSLNLNGDNYLFYPANFRTHKNHENLIKAFALIYSSNRSYKLYFTGYGTKRIKKLCISLGVSSNIIFLGDVNDADLVDYYLNSCGLIFPSYYEGFGIPLVEALHLNVPIACSDISVFNEIVKNAAIFFDPYNIEDIAKSMLILFKKNYPEKLFINARKIRANYSFDKFYQHLKKQIYFLTNEK